MQSVIQESLVQKPLPVHKFLLLIHVEICTEIGSKLSKKPDRAIQQCNFISFDSTKKLGLMCFFKILFS